MTGLRALNSVVELPKGIQVVIERDQRAGPRVAPRDRERACHLRIDARTGPGHVVLGPLRDVAGFGFPVRFKIELSDDESFQREVRLVVDHTKEDFANPGIALLTFPAEQASGRFCRVTATKLATRQNDFIFALAELRILNVSGDNLAQGSLVSALDTIEAAPRWGKLNLIDGYYRGVTTSTEMSLADLQRQRCRMPTRPVA